MRMKNWFQRVVACVAMLAVGALCSSAAFAVDRVTLADGKVIEGEITRELDGYVFIKTSIGGIDQVSSYAPAQISKIERDITKASTKPAEAKSDAKADAVTPTTPVPPAPTSGKKVPKGAIITLGEGGDKDMVGVYMTAEILKRAIPTLEKELGTDRTGIVVFRIHSGGGSGREVQLLSDVIHNEYKPRWRVVGWIENAISAAAMTSHCIEEIYFTTEGRYGACTGFYGSIDKPVEGVPLEKMLFQMEKISARGNYDSQIMRAMQVQYPLSAHIDSNGDVHFYGDLTSGDIIVNRQKEILTFNAVTAARVKFSKGTADTLEDLQRLMGYQEIEWVGEKVKNVPWPVSRAEKLQMDYREQTKRDEDNTRLYWTSYQRALAAAEGAQNRDDRGMFVGRARQWLNKIKDMVRNNPAFRESVFGMEEEEFKEWLEKQERLMRDLMR